MVLGKKVNKSHCKVFTTISSFRKNYNLRFVFFRGPVSLMKRDEFGLDENTFGTFYEAGPDPYSNYKDMFGKRYSHPGTWKRGPEHMWRSKDSESEHSKNDAPFIYLDIPLDLPMMGF